MCGGRFLTPRCTGDLNFFCPSWRRPSIPHPAQVFFARHSQASSPGSFGSPCSCSISWRRGSLGGPPKWAFFGINLDFFLREKVHLRMCTALLHFIRFFMPRWSPPATLAIAEKEKKYSEKGLLLDACTCGRKRAKGAVVDSPKNKSK